MNTPLIVTAVIALVVILLVFAFLVMRSWRTASLSEVVKLVSTPPHSRSNEHRAQRGAYTKYRWGEKYTGRNLDGGPSNWGIEVDYNCFRNGAEEMVLSLWDNATDCDEYFLVRNFRDRLDKRNMRKHNPLSYTPIPREEWVLLKNIQTCARRSTQPLKMAAS